MISGKRRMMWFFLNCLYKRNKYSTPILDKQIYIYFHINIEAKLKIYIFLNFRLRALNNFIDLLF